MPNPPIPPTTSIKRNRVRNIDTARLMERADFLRAWAADGFPGIENRHPFAMKAMELKAIEDELDRREVPFHWRRTLTSEQSAAMSSPSR